MPNEYGWLANPGGSVSLARCVELPLSMVRALVIAALLLGPAIASGEPRRTIDAHGSAPFFGFVGKTRGDGKILARQVVPAKDTVDLDLATDEPVALAQSRILYLNKTGVVLSPGENDARLNRSSIVTAQTAIPAWNVSATNWNNVVLCMRELFAAYDVQIVETDPGSAPHMEAVFGGSPTQLGMDENVLGVSPFTTDCSVIENSVVFTFTGAFSLTPREACEIMAQEVAHSYGLDHVLLASDPMTYLPYEGRRTFKDQTAQCGEDTPRVCGINGSVCRMNQNSVELLTERLGAVVVAPAPPEPPEPLDLGTNDVIGGCAVGSGDQSALLALGLLALTARRRR